MSEMLFLITGLFVAYVVYVIVNEKKGDKQKHNPVEAVKQPQAASAPAKAKPVEANLAAASVEPVKTAASPKPASPKAAPKPATAVKKTAAPKAAPAKAAAPEPLKSKGLKDPTSGEVVSSYGNYRFMKRWIKEALVAEGLLDKVYKNDELNSAVETNIKAAITKLEANKKYQP